MDNYTKDEELNEIPDVISTTCRGCGHEIAVPIEVWHWNPLGRTGPLCEDCDIKVRPRREQHNE